MNVLTTKGLIEMSDMEVKDVIEVGDNYRKVATEYRYQGELVRRSVAVEALRPLETEGVQGAING